MKNILLYTLLLTATLTYAQGLLPEEKVKKESPAQPVQQAKKYDWKDEYYEGYYPYGDPLDIEFAKNYDLSDNPYDMSTEEYYWYLEDYDPD